MEKWQVLDEIGKIYSAGAKAQYIFCCFCGPAEAVPFYKAVG